MRRWPSGLDPTKHILRVILNDFKREPLKTLIRVDNINVF